MPDAKASASGTLQKTPLVHLLVYLLERKMTGTLVLETPTGEKSAIYFHRGVPAKAKTAVEVYHLGRVLLDQGSIDQATLTRTLGEVAAGKLHGEVLVAEGALDAKGLVEALREQVFRKLTWMFELPPETAYGYFGDQNLLERWGGPEVTPIDPLPALWIGVRLTADPERIREAVVRLGDGVVRLRHDAPLTRFGFGHAEKAVIDLLRARPQSHPSLVATGIVPAADIDRLLYALSIARCLDVGVPGEEAPPRVASVAPRASRAPLRVAAPQEPDEEPPPSSSSRRAPLDPAMAVFKREIVDRAGNVDKLNFYEILGIPRTISTGDVQRAFFEQAKRWHPDRLGPEFASVRGAATKVFARMSEAAQVLGSDAQRKQYDELLKTGTGSADEAEEVQKALNAVTTFQKAEVLAKKNDLTGAFDLAKKAYDVDPTQPEYAALYAWLSSQRPERAQSGKYKDLIDLLNQSVDKTPNNVKIRFWRAQVLKRAGDVKEAMKDLKFIVKRDQNHLEASRELRLLRMRGVSDSVPPGRKSVPPGAGGAAGNLGGFLKGIFKKD